MYWSLHWVDRRSKHATACSRVDWNTPTSKGPNTALIARGQWALSPEEIRPKEATLWESDNYCKPILSSHLSWNERNNYALLFCLRPTLLPNPLLWSPWPRLGWCPWQLCNLLTVWPEGLNFRFIYRPWWIAEISNIFRVDSKLNE